LASIEEKIMRAVRPIVMAAALVAAVPAFAQSQQEHDAHHPGGGGGAQAQTPAQPAPPQAGTAGPGMMGQGMMQGMTGSGMGRGMMGGNMMGQSGGMMPMMNMMMRGQSGVERIEGRLAFIKTELKISEAQTPQWNAFAGAMRSNAAAMAEMRNMMMSQQSAGTLPDRLALEDKAVTAHLAALKKTAEAVGQLYKVLNDEQKKTADSIIVGPMGMPMGMM
jgi:LTXXQ motif family protein